MFLCGSFTRWVGTLQMHPVDGQPNLFQCFVSLPPGYHQFKYIADGEWRYDEEQEFVTDPMGNVNNQVYIPAAVSLAPGAGGAGGPLPPGMPHGAAAATELRARSDSLDLHRRASLDQQRRASAAGSEGRPEAAGGGGGGGADASMGDVAVGPGGLVPPMPLEVGDELAFTRRKVSEFLASHTAYELIPDSGKLVVIDTQLPVRQAFHTLYEQGIPMAPIWDSETCTLCGMVSASDFIDIMNRLQSGGRAGAPAAGGAGGDLDGHTIAAWREARRREGKLRQLVFVRPEDSLRSVIKTILQSGCALVPVLAMEGGGELEMNGMGVRAPQLLHLASISGVLAYICRHFKASMASLPLMASPLGGLPVGTWNAGEGNSTEQGRGKGGGKLHVVTRNTHLSQALSVLLSEGISSVPVVDESGTLQDSYARSDIIKLGKGEAYSQLLWSEITVHQALDIAHSATEDAPDRTAEAADAGSSAPRVYVCSKSDTLRTIVETLALPGVRRVVVIHPETRQVQGVVSLMDVAMFLLQEGDPSAEESPVA